jgi:hypothetical protein
LDSTEKDISPASESELTIGDTTVFISKDSSAADYRVRLSRLGSTPPLTDKESLILSSAQSDVVRIEIFETATSKPLSSSDLLTPYEFKQTFTTSSPNNEIGLMVINDVGTPEESRLLIPNSELRVTEVEGAGTGLRMTSSQEGRQVSVSGSLKFTNAVVWLVAYKVQATEVLATSDAAGAVVSELTKLVAKPGDQVGIKGIKMHGGLNVEIAGKIVAVVADSGTSARFTMPDVRSGLISVAVKEGSSTVKSLGLVSDSAGDGIPIVLMEASEICSDKQFRNASGTVVQGTRNCAGPDSCDADGETNCVANSEFAAAATAGLANKVLSGNTVAGVPGAASGSGASASDAWNIRAGATVAGVTGKLKVNCRNGVNSSIYNYDGSLSGIDGNGVTSGNSLDPWDTIDDYNNGAILSVFPNANLPGSWTSDNFCGGKDTASTPDDNAVWRDLTTGTCDGAGKDCIFLDKISGLQWSELQGTSRTWPQALNDCDSLNFGGHTDWRLPTQKELMDAYSHGIRSAGTTNWMTSAQMNANFWSGSSVSTNTYAAWIVYLSYGNTYGNDKTGTASVSCVR